MLIECALLHFYQQISSHSSTNINTIQDECVKVYDKYTQNTLWVDEWLWVVISTHARIMLIKILLLFWSWKYECQHIKWVCVTHTFNTCHHIKFDTHCILTYNYGFDHISHNILLTNIMCIHTNICVVCITIINTHTIITHTPNSSYTYTHQPTHYNTPKHTYFDINTHQHTNTHNKLINQRQPFFINT